MSEDSPGYGWPAIASPSRILTVEQAAELLGVRPKTVRALAAGGVIPAVKLGKFWRFDEGLLRDWLRTKAAANVAAPHSVRDLAPGGLRVGVHRPREDLGARLDRMIAEPPTRTERKRRAPPVMQ